MVKTFFDNWKNWGQPVEQFRTQPVELFFEKRKEKKKMNSCQVVPFAIEVYNYFVKKKKKN
jgi:hypothetical protein